MKSTLRKALPAILSLPLLFAFQCEEDPEFDLVYNPTRVSLSQGPVFSRTDTLWITGRVSSRAYDRIGRDSILPEDSWMQDVFGVLRLQPATNTFNSIGVVSDFKVVVREGSVEPIGRCPEGEIAVIGALTEDGNQYKYSMGLVPESTGDFVLSWQGAVIFTNAHLNVDILANYPLDGTSNTLGMNLCGSTSTRLGVATERLDFFFTVE